jgi:oxygen-dependent protoporphyrinogen oxidase
MIGALDKRHREVTVIGAGIAGLIAAYRLDRLGFEVTLLDSAQRAGGVIQTYATSFGPAEAAVHSVLASPAVVDFFEDLGVPMVGVDPASRARFIWRDGRMRKMPLGPWEALGAGARAFFRKAPEASPSGLGSESATLEEFALHHLGKAALDFGLNPFLRGIYAARPSEISLRAAFPGLEVSPGRTFASEMRQKRRARRGPRPWMVTARDGMESLVRALEKRLRERLGSRFQLGVQVDQLPDAPNVVVCTPAGRAAALLASPSPDAARALEAVRYAPLVSVTVFAGSEKFLQGAPRGVGVLVPENQRDRKCLGILFNSSAFPGRVSSPDLSSFTVMLGGSSAPEWAQKSEDEIRETVTAELQAMLGLQGQPEYQQVTCWERAIPVYAPSLLSVWKALRTTLGQRPGRVLFGNYTGQVSVRGLIETPWI